MFIIEGNRRSDVIIEPAHLHGSIPAIPSKSYAQRLLIAATLAKSPTKIKIAVHALADDLYATIRTLWAMGAAIDMDPEAGHITVTPDGADHKSGKVNAGESGTVARLILPVLTALFDSGTLGGEGSLLKRPFATLCKTLQQGSPNLEFDQHQLPISWTGQLQPGSYHLPGDESSQYLSGLLFALPLLDGDSTIVLTTPLESAGYVDMTLDVLQQFGIHIEYDASTNTYTVPGKQTYQSPGTITAEGDWSNAAFWLAANVEVTGLDPQSLQRDRSFLTVKDSNHINATDVPDLVPILSVNAALQDRTTTITGIKRLRIKESDRIETTIDLLTRLGCNIELTAEDELTIRGTGAVPGGAEVSGANDHRIVMAAAIAGSFAQSPVTIIDAQAVAKTYPHFFEDFTQLGGQVKIKRGGLAGRLMGRGTSLT